jgi:hypothetical protein
MSKSKLSQAIAVNLKYEKLQAEARERFYAAGEDKRTFFSGEMLRLSGAHDDELKALGYRHRDVDMDGLGDLPRGMETSKRSKHWLIRITKSWTEHRKRRWRLTSALFGFQTCFMVKEQAFDGAQEFKHFNGTVEQNLRKADKIERFLALQVDDFERAWKKLGLDKDISSVWTGV